MNFKPYGDFILVKPIIEEKSKGGIYLPKTDTRHMIRAEVIAVSDGFISNAGHHCELTSKVGDMVYFQQGLGEPVNIHGEDYLIMREMSVFGKEVFKRVEEEGVLGIIENLPEDEVAEMINEMNKNKKEA